MAKVEIFFCPSSSQRGHGSGEKKVFMISACFDRVAGKTVSLPLKFAAKYDTFASKSGTPIFDAS